MVTTLKLDIENENVFPKLSNFININIEMLIWLCSTLLIVTLKYATLFQSWFDFFRSRNFISTQQQCSTNVEIFAVIPLSYCKSKFNYPISIAFIWQETLNTRNISSMSRYWLKESTFNSDTERSPLTFPSCVGSLDKCLNAVVIDD